MRDARSYAVTEPLAALLRSHATSPNVRRRGGTRIGTTRTLRNTIKSCGSAKRSQIPQYIQCCSMKPASFEYARPADLDQACAMLAADDDVRIIAGGQTLVPLMAMRLARPRLVVDIARIAELAFVRRGGDAVAIGATTRQCMVERDQIVRANV